MLSGAKPTLDFDHLKIKYSVSDPDESFEGRSIHAKEEEIRRLFSDLSRSVNTMGSQIVAKQTNFSVTNIRFPQGDARLDESARRFLTEFCLHLQQYSGSKPVKLYVLGLAGDETTEKEQWILSAERAQAVADFLQGVLPLGPGWRVYSWGAGPGGDWVREDSPISKQSQILIAILRQGD
jgi:outer membrane protein OmpA-like peptidoglycan-associated protein